MESLLKNTSLLVFIIAGALFGVVIVGGILFGVLSNLITSWTASTAPSEEAMTAWNAKQFKTVTAELASPKPLIKLTLRNEPFLVSLLAFLMAFTLSSFFVKVPVVEAVATQDPAATPKPVKLKSCKTAETCAVQVKLLPTNGNVAHGLTLYNEQGCIGCHSLEKGKIVVGPSYYGVYTRAATRKPGYSPQEYIYESIVNPNNYVVDGFQPNIMNGGFLAALSQQDMADILAWMKTANAQTD